MARVKKRQLRKIVGGKFATSDDAFRVVSE
jgi:hypothetical protein